LGCSPFADTLINLSQGGNTSYRWDFGDGEGLTTESMRNLVHVYHTGSIDTFTVTLFATNRCGVHSDSLDIVVTPNSIRPAVLVNGNSLRGCAPFNVRFINNSTGAAQIAFDYNDGSPVALVAGNQSTITHQFLQAGVYRIGIRLSNGCADTSVSQTITVYATPSPAFTVAPNPACTGVAVSTTNLSTNANSYLFDWGDSSHSDGAINPSHAYAQAGVYSVRLRASLVNEFGTMCGVTGDPVVVQVVDLIKARIDTGVNKPCAPYLMSVRAVDATSAASVEWTFYDASRPEGFYRASGQTASYQYNSPGSYRVMLVVRNEGGCADTSIHAFRVSASPVVKGASIGSVYSCVDTTISIAASVDNAGGAVSWAWTVNGEIVGAGNPFEYSFQGVGANEVKVTARNDRGCTDTAAMGVVTLRPLAVPRIAVSPDSILYQPNYTFSFRDNVTHASEIRYVWDPGDGNGWSNQREMTHAYGDTGIYHVSLRVSDAVTGCVRGDTMQVRILHTPGFLYVPDAICPGCAVAELRTFLPKGRGLKDYRLRIYNGWGQLVFETSKLDSDGAPAEPWDARWNGKPMQQDAYRWQIEARYINGTEWKGMVYPGKSGPVKSGFITVVR
jgi:PKD repeat protein